MNNKWEMHLMKSIWSNLEMIHWICALNSWFLLRLSLVFVNIFSWNDNINGFKNLRSGDSCNHFYRSTSSNYSTCNPQPWCWNTYVIKEEFIQLLKIKNISYYHRKSWKGALKKQNYKTFKAAQKSCVMPNPQIVIYYWET